MFEFDSRKQINIQGIDVNTKTPFGMEYTTDFRGLYGNKFWKFRLNV